MDNPLVSVVMPTYNHEPYIAQSIEGASMQKTDFHFEILIGEDDSADGTRQICKEYAAKYPDKIRLFLNDRKNVIYNISGQPTGRWNLFNLLKNAKGKYIALCDGDDYWTDPYKLQKQVDFLEAHPDYVICYHNAVIIDEAGKLISNSKLPDNLKRDFSSCELKTGLWVLTLAMCFRNVINEFPDVFYELFHGDTFLVSVLGNYGKGKYLSNIQDAVYRKHPNSIWSSLPEIKRSYLSLDVYAMLHRYYSILEDDKYALYFKNVVIILFQKFIQRWSGLNDDAFIVYFSKLLKDYRDILDEKTVTACTGHLTRNFYKRAMYNYNQNNYNEAIFYFRKVADLNPKHATVFNDLGVIYYKTGELDKAIENFAKAFEIAPNDRDTMINCCEIFKSLGKIGDARAIYSAWLKRNPNYEVIASALENLTRDAKEARVRSQQE